MVKPGILPVAVPLVLVPVLGVSAVHVAQTNVSAWAAGIEMTAQVVKIKADTELLKKFLNFMIKLHGRRWEFVEGNSFPGARGIEELLMGSLERRRGGVKGNRMNCE